MPTIQVTKKTSETYEVMVKDRTDTRHTVTLTEDYYQRISTGKATPEDLIEKSFEFLLERESNTMILRAFDLPVIARYFPEYEQSIQQRL